ncbi:MAG: NAD(P)/FAD-dependent oxidoreductase [Euzebyaceae bacterium]|nr:NAD(P)/FAD-dependent oxidoreductase [Euzebyaceae bacterium]
MGANRPRVVIVGAGFGGLTAALALRAAPVEVVLVDRTNHHLFQPLLYQVATASLEPADIASAVRGIIRRSPNTSFRSEEVTGVDWASRRLHTADGADIPYDQLVIAGGADTATYGIPGVAEHAFGLKTLEDAVHLRTHLLRQFEAADRRPDLLEVGAASVVVVGGGATGVEMAGALVELFHGVLAKDFPALEVARARVVLVEAGEALLPPFHRELGDHARRLLADRGVEVLLGRAVAEVTAERVQLDDGRTIPTRTVLWAAGVRAAGLADVLGLEQAGGGRLVVRDDLTVPGRPDVWAIGDIAAATDAQGRPYPQVAPVAMQAARHLAEQIQRRLGGETTAPFRYLDKGMMATIGRRAAVTQLPFPFPTRAPRPGRRTLRFRGTLAWIMWLFLHLVTLIGFRNRLSVLLNWAWNYVTSDRAARLILSTPTAVAARPPPRS